MYHGSLDPETLPGGGALGLAHHDIKVTFHDLIRSILQESGHDSPNHLYEQCHKNINKLLKWHLPMENV